MAKIPKKNTFKQLILAKILLQKSEALVNDDSMESNLAAIFNLNSALEIILKILTEYSMTKIKSIKQLKTGSLEMHWSVLSQEYKKRYGQDLSMKTQIFTINNLILDFTDHGLTTKTNQISDLNKALSIFMEDVINNIFGLNYSELDLFQLIPNPQVRQEFRAAKWAYNSNDLASTFRYISASFHIALEDQRQKLNYLSDQGLLKPEAILLKEPINIHFSIDDEEFIHLVLGTNPKKLERFKQLVPSAMITQDRQGKPEVVVSDYVDKSLLSTENAIFCMNFLLETILDWENLDLIKK